MFIFLEVFQKIGTNNADINYSRTSGYWFLSQGCLASSRCTCLQRDISVCLTPINVTYDLLCNLVSRHFLHFVKVSALSSANITNIKATAFKTSMSFEEELSQASTSYRRICRTKFQSQGFRQIAL